MSIKYSLLALMTEGPMYGARLRSEFEARTGGTWPLNVGQVYTTVDRLVRDGLVETLGTSQDRGRIAYQLTPEGRRQVTDWWQTPVDHEVVPRNELAIKLALAVTVPGIDVLAVVQTQRVATLRHLQQLTRLKRQTTSTESAVAAADPELAWGLVVEHLIYGAEAEVRWLDHVEARLAREAARPAAADRRSGEPEIGPEQMPRPAEVGRSEGP